MASKRPKKGDDAFFGISAYQARNRDTSPVTVVTHGFHHHHRQRRQQMASICCRQIVGNFYSTLFFNTNQ